MINKVLDKGFVRLLDVMGDDHAIAAAARVSYTGQKIVSDDEKLIRYLMDNDHSSPLEMAELKFHIKCPLFVARQWTRHRTGNYSEKSGRYTKSNSEEYYLPEYEHINKQSKHNNQGRGDFFDEVDTKDILQIIRSSSDDSFTSYEELNDMGVAKEIARIVLPQNMYTEYYFKIDLKNLLHFLKLRMDEHAQLEIRLYANVIADMVEDRFPITWKAFCDYELYAVKLSALACNALLNLIQNKRVTRKSLHEIGMSKNESSKFIYFIQTRLGGYYDEGNDEVVLGV